MRTSSGVGEPAAMAAVRLVPEGGAAAASPVTVDVLCGASTPADAFGARLSCSPPSATGRCDVRLEIEYRGERAVVASVRVGAEVAEPTDEPWWLVPGAFYRENRPAGCLRIFPRFEVGADDPAGMVSDHWEFRADRAATPAVMGWAGSGGLALVTTETSALGMTGLGFAHDADTRRAAVHLTFPFREGPISYDGTQLARAPEVMTYLWQPGERVSLELAVYELADRHGYAAVLREEHERRRTSSPLRPWVDVAGAAVLAAEGLRR
jgi:hypothetical protein